MAMKIILKRQENKSDWNFQMSETPHFDLIVIGSGPAGEKAAAKAAYFGKKVVVVESSSMLGGAGVNTGTLPSKTLKESALYFSGKYDRGLHGLEKISSKKPTLRTFSTESV